MAQLFNFTRLIQKYSDTFTFHGVASDGSYKGGEWVPDAPPEPIKKQGAIVPLTAQKVYQLGGSYTTQDRQLYMCSSLPDVLKGATVEYQEHTYNVEQDADWSTYADVYVYLLRRVSKFENTEGS